MVKKYFKRIRIGFIFLLVAYLTGCSYFKTVDIIDTFSEEDEIYTFYGKAKFRSYIDEKCIQDINFIEWKGTGKKYHSEAVGTMDKDFYEEYYSQSPPQDLVSGNLVKTKEEDTYDDKQLIIYLPYENKYSIKEVTLADEVSPIVLIGINQVLNAGGLKDYATARINELAKGYSLEMKDNVKVNSRLTQHITAISKMVGENEIQEVWIDQDTWLIIKERIISGNYTEEFEYLDFKFNPRVDDHLFKVDIPEGAEIIYLDSDLAKVNEEVTLEEAPIRLGKPVFYLEDEDTKLVSAKYIEHIDDDYGWIQLTYKLADGREIIVESSPYYKVYDKIQLGYERIKVQGQEALYQAQNESKCIEFVKGQTICDIYIKNSEMSKNELIQMANRLKIKESSEEE